MKSGLPPSCARCQPRIVQFPRPYKPRPAALHGSTYDLGEALERLEIAVRFGRPADVEIVAARVLRSAIETEDLQLYAAAELARTVSEFIWSTSQ